MALNITDNALNPGNVPPMGSNKKVETATTPNVANNPNTPTPVATNMATDQNFQNLLNFLKTPGNTTLGVKEMAAPVEPVQIQTAPQTDLTGLSGLNNSLLSSILGSKPSTDKQELSSFLKTALESDQTGRVGLEATSPELQLKEQAVNKLNTEIQTLDKEYREQVENIRNTTSGITREQQQGFLSDAQYRYENRRANIAIAYNSAIGDLQATQNAIQRKTEALDNQWNKNIQTYQLISNAIQNDLTEKEKIIVQANIEDLQNRKQMVYSAYSDVMSALSKNPNTPSYIYDAVDIAANRDNASAADIYKAAGNFLTLPVSGEFAGEPVISPYQEERMIRNLQSINDLKPRVSWQTVGAFGAPAGFVPGSVARDFKLDVETLIANITFGELTAMREASKTGGALGQISDRENQLLGAALGSLKTSQSPANFRKNLKNVEDSIKRWQNAVQKYSGATVETTDTNVYTVNGVNYTQGIDGLYYPAQ